MGNERDITIVAISKHLLFFLLFLVTTPFARNILGLEVSFAPSDGIIANDLYIMGQYEGVYGRSIELDTAGFHIFMQKQESQKRGWIYGDKTGQIAHKFVYNAVLDLEQNYVEIAKNVLRRKGLI